MLKIYKDTPTDRQVYRTRQTYREPGADPRPKFLAHFARPGNSPIRQDRLLAESRNFFVRACPPLRRKRNFS